MRGQKGDVLFETLSSLERKAHRPVFQNERGVSASVKCIKLRMRAVVSFPLHTILVQGRIQGGPRQVEHDFKHARLYACMRMALYSADATVVAYLSGGSKGDLGGTGPLSGPITHQETRWPRLETECTI